MGLMTTTRDRILRPICRTLFSPASRFPADPRAVFILLLSVFSGLTTLLIDAGPGTLEALIPKWGVILWGALLLVGSAVTLTGMWFDSINGIILEQVGSVTVGVTTLFYSILALVTVGPTAGQPIGIILAWGLSCLIRWLQLQMLLRKIYTKHVVESVQERIIEELS